MKWFAPHNYNIKRIHHSERKKNPAKNQVLVMIRFIKYNFDAVAFQFKRNAILFRFRENSMKDVFMIYHLWMNSNKA